MYTIKESKKLMGDLQSMPNFCHLYTWEPHHALDVNYIIIDHATDLDLYELTDWVQHNIKKLFCAATWRHWRFEDQDEMFLFKMYWG